MQHTIMGTTIGELREVQGRVPLLKAELRTRRTDAYLGLAAPQVSSLKQGVHPCKLQACLSLSCRRDAQMHISAWQLLR